MRVAAVFSATVSVLVVLSSDVRVFVSVVIVAFLFLPAIRFPSRAEKAASLSKRSSATRWSHLLGFTTFCGIATARTWLTWERATRANAWAPKATGEAGRVIQKKLRADRKIAKHSSTGKA